MNINNCSLKDECEYVKELKNKISNMQESYETDAEAKFYDYLGKHENELEKENQELKKQLEKANKKLYLCTPEVPQNLHGKYVSYVDLVNEMYELKKQQQEFIKWLENYLNLFDNMDIDEQISYDTIEEILQKYKEIIGI